jgi:3-keto-L-gulonate-6-phosphate decarboxylase
MVVELISSEDTSNWFEVLGSLDILTVRKAVNGDESQDVQLRIEILCLSTWDVLRLFRERYRSWNGM